MEGIGFTAEHDDSVDHLHDTKTKENNMVIWYKSAIINPNTTMNATFGSMYASLGNY